MYIWEEVSGEPCLRGELGKCVEEGRVGVFIDG